MCSLYDHLRRWATAQPEVPCIIEAETGSVLTYRRCLFLGKSSRRSFP
jgi:hypothetical protein